MSGLCHFICLLMLCACHGNPSATKEKGGKRETADTAPEKEETRYVNSIRLTSPEKNGRYNFGEELTVSFENKDRSPIDSAAITLNGREIARLGKGEKRYTFRVPEGKAGHNILKVTAWHPDRKQGTASVPVLLKPAEAPVRYGYKIEKVFPHDTEAYTQGLLYRDGYLYESTGQYGESSIRKIDLTSGKALAVLNIDSRLFGEGITIFRDRIIQLTWRSGKGFIYDLATFSLKSTFTYRTEGWGITTAGDRLIMSDGSNRLYHLAPSTFNLLKETEVCDHNGEVTQLNELEYIDGMVWANVWLTDRIVVIDPETGAVQADLDLSELLTAAERKAIRDQDDVLNGIAWNPQTNTIYVTGKRWPKLFEITIQKKTTERHHERQN